MGPRLGAVPDGRRIATEFGHTGLFVVTLGIQKFAERARAYKQRRKSSRRQLEAALWLLLVSCVEETESSTTFTSRREAANQAVAFFLGAECLLFNRGEVLAWRLLFGPLRRLPAEAFHRHANSPLKSPSARMSFRLPLFRSQSAVRSWRWTEVGVYQARRGLKTSDH